ncbi:hypothetical protein CEXT_321241 [Caerostris extrusa]|uniref:Uncharacterized protein n=1 Tax=Caerostris extrusa TaxID=172846 RepID=A0AAV4PYD8_CAEEX|nr:hypothetical protein CEXT_321241 [Caerostris extrusa]
MQNSKKITHTFIMGYKIPMHPAPKMKDYCSLQKNQNSVGTRLHILLESLPHSHLRCLLHKCFPRGERSTPLLHTVNLQRGHKTIVRSAWLVVIVAAWCQLTLPQPKQF